MVERQEVEALLREAQNVAPADAVFGEERIGVEGSTLAALCRAWLAVNEAPVGEYEYIVSDVAYIHFDNEGDAPSWSGDRVRIVKEVEE